MKGISYLNKLIMYGVIMGLLPTLLLGMYSYQQASTSIVKQTKESHRQKLIQDQFQVEQVLSTVDLMLSSFMNTPIVYNSIELPLVSDYYDRFKQINEHLRKLQINKLGVHNVYFYNRHNHWVINNDGIFSDKEKIIEEPLRKILQFMNDTEQVKWASNEEFVYLLRSYPEFSNEKTAFFVVEFPRSHFSKLMSAGNQLQGNFILNGHSKAISSSYPDTESISAHIAEQLANQEEMNGYFAFKFNGERFGINYRKSSLNDWIYVSVFSMNEITKNTMSIAILTLMICLIIAIILSVIALQASKKIYSPVYKAQNQLLGQLKGQTVQLKDFFVQKLLKGQLTSKEVAEKCELYGYSQSHWNKIVVLAVQVEGLAGTSYEEKDSDLLLFAVNNMVSELIPEEWRLNPVVTEGAQATIVGVAEEELDFSREKLFRLAQTIQTNVAKYLKLPVEVGISREYESLTDSDIAYMEAIAALRFRIGLQHSAILFIEDVQSDQSFQSSYPKLLEGELVNAVLRSDLEEAEILLDKFCQKVFQEPLNYAECQTSLVRLLSRFIGLLQDEGIASHPLHGKDQTAYETLLSLKSVGKVKEWLKYVIMEQVSELVEENRTNQQQNISEQMLKMIQNEYDTNLSLEECASKLNYNPQYLSRVFRQETGLTFSECLTRHRLLKAKQWLVETDMKIGDIAEKLMYTTPANFIRFFRKETDMTPGQYREESRKTHSAKGE